MRASDIPRDWLNRLLREVIMLIYQKDNKIKCER